MLLFIYLNFRMVTITDSNYHLELLGESVENFLKLVDLQILVKRCQNKSYEARRFTQKEFASSLYEFVVSVEAWLCAENQHHSSIQS